MSDKQKTSNRITDMNMSLTDRMFFYFMESFIV